jgi:hypothetical protein
MPHSCVDTYFHSTAAVIFRLVEILFVLVLIAFRNSETCPILIKLSLSLRFKIHSSEIIKQNEFDGRCSRGLNHDLAGIVPSVPVFREQQILPMLLTIQSMRGDGSLFRHVRPSDWLQMTALALQTQGEMVLVCAKTDELRIA